MGGRGAPHDDNSLSPGRHKTKKNSLLYHFHLPSMTFLDPAPQVILHSQYQDELVITLKVIGIV